MKYLKFAFVVIVVFLTIANGAEAQQSSGVQIDLEVNNPTEATSTPPSGSDPEARYFLSNMFILTDRNSALISWISSVPAISKISWGLTEDYERGVLSEVTHFKIHASKIVNLDPGTQYFFKIESISSNGVRFQDFKSSFTTATYEVDLPPNVTNLSALSSLGGVNLSWSNPVINFENIRIVKSDKGFPIDYLDGEVIYEGRNDYFNDSKVVNGKTYYYAVFVKSVDKYSSGSLVSIRYTVDDFSVSIPPDIYEGDIGMYGKLDISDFDFVQFDEKISFIQDGVIVTVNEDINLILPIENVPPSLLEKLGHIVIVVPSPVKNFYFNRYLTKLSPDSKFFEAVIPAFLKVGIFPFHIEVYGTDNRLLDKVPGKFVVINESSVNEVVGIERGDVGLIKDLILWLILLILLVIIQRWLRRKKED